MDNYQDDDLRSIIDRLHSLGEKKTEEPEPAAPVAENLKASKELEKFDSALNITNDIRQLSERVERLEVLNYGLWLMLQKKGYTNEEYDAAIAIAKDTIKNTAAANTKQSIPCPKCGKLLQVANVFGIKCIYCGYEQVGNPYQFSAAVDVNAEPVEPEYNVEDDLRFDEL